MDGEPVRARVVVGGRVQGVFFRAQTRDMALRLGLAGWVMNRRDGSVEAVFEGDRAAVEDAVEWARTGPPAARVSSVDVSWEDTSNEDGFRVRYG